MGIAVTLQQIARESSQSAATEQARKWLSAVNDLIAIGTFATAQQLLPTSNLLNLYIITNGKFDYEIRM